MSWNVKIINHVLVVLATACILGLFASAALLAKSAIDTTPAPHPAITIEHVITNNVCNRA